MDFSNPIGSFIPGVRGRVLKTLLEAPRPLSIRQMARLSKVSAPQAGNVLDQLTEEGLVLREDIPPAMCYELNREHLLAPLLCDLNESWSRAVEEIQTVANSLRPSPVSVILFGSMARKEATSDSDIDVLFVRPSEINEDDDAWWEAMEMFRVAVYSFCGNDVRIIEYGIEELKERLDEPRGFWESVIEDEIVLSGTTLRSFMGKAWQKVA